jgi:putative ABC transport system permease protein
MATAPPQPAVSPTPTPTRARPPAPARKPSISPLTSFDRTLASAANTISFRETIALAVDSFKASKVRYLLTMLGMVIGSASIVLVATLGLSGKQYAIAQLSSIGPNRIEMQYGGGSIIGPDNTSTPDNMTYEDMTTVLDQVPGIVYSSPMLEDHATISMGNGHTKDTLLLGVSPQYKEVRNLRILAGRFFDDQDALLHTKVAVLIKPLADELFGSPAKAIGNTISIRGIPFTIIGVCEESFDTRGLSEISDQTILVPYEVARYFTGTDKVKEINFTMKNAADVVPASKQIETIIRNRHRPSSVYNAFVMTGILNEMTSIANYLTIVFSLAAGIALFVSGIGIMNSMLANVSARTREIGIRKALGATAKEIRLQFLTEAVFLSLSGGVVGTVIGIAIPMLVSFLTPVQIPVSYISAVIALLTSVAVGVFFGITPAARAAALDPVETLKYE